MSDDEKDESGPFDGLRLVQMFADVETVAHVMGTTVRSVHRWVEHGLSWSKADRLAVKAGFHPAELWGDVWWDAALAPEPDVEQMQFDDLLRGTKSKTEKKGRTRR